MRSSTIFYSPHMQWISNIMMVLESCKPTQRTLNSAVTLIFAPNLSAFSYNEFLITGIMSVKCLDWKTTIKEIFLIEKSFFLHVCSFKELGSASITASFISSFYPKIVLSLEYGISICWGKVFVFVLGFSSAIQIILSFSSAERIVYFPTHF